MALAGAAQRRGLLAKPCLQLVEHVIEVPAHGRERAIVRDADHAPAKPASRHLLHDGLQIIDAAAVHQRVPH